MTSRARQVARDLAPPILTRALGRQSRGLTRFLDGYASWDAASAVAWGYDDTAILAQVERATDDVIAGRAAFERDGIIFDEIQYRWPVAAALFRQAAIDHGSLKVLDFGGSLGSTYRQYSPILGSIDTRWGVVEQPNFVAAGRRFETQVLRFHESVADCVLSLAPNVGLLSSVLQYLPSPFEVLDEIAQSGARTIIIDRTPMTELDHDIPAVQIVPPTIYEASYPTWLFSRERLARRLVDWHVIDTFPGIEPDLTTPAGVSVSWLGMILAKRST